MKASFVFLPLFLLLSYIMAQTAENPGKSLEKNHFLINFL
jgi:hypothetical protein